MSERVNFTPENISEVEHQRVERMLPTAEQAEALRAGEQDPQKLAAEARQDIAETAKAESGKANALEQLQAAEKAPAAAAPTHITKQLRQITLQRELQQIRRKLSAPQRTLSKVIHQPAVRVASEVAGKTVSRPSGILGGGVVAFIGSTGYLYLAKHVGMEYNYSVFLALFVGGFALGLAIELFTNLIFRRRAHQA